MTEIQAQTLSAEADCSSLWRQGVAIGSTAVLVLLATTGCERHPHSSPAPNTHTAANSAPTGVPASYLPYNPCIQPKAGLNAEVREELARRCLSAEHGRLDIINYASDSIPPVRADRFAQAIAKLLAQATDGTIRLTPHIVVASPKARAALRAKMGKAQCVDGNNYLAAKIAAENMPETNSAAAVEALVPYKPCEHGLGGQADSVTRRLADVYIPQFQNGKDAPAIIETGAHEVGHLYGLGHSGNILFKQPDGSKGDLYDVSIQGHGALLDISALLARGYSYDEYHDVTNLMGGGSGNLTPLTSPVQLNELGWPKAVLAGKDNLLSKTVTNKWQQITLAQAQANQILNYPYQSR